MAKYELTCYGANDEVLKRFATNVCPWGVFIKAASLQDEIKSMTVTEQMRAVGEILKSVFADLTDEDLERADSADVFNTFSQIANSGMMKKVNSKNA